MLGGIGKSECGDSWRERSVWQAWASTPMDARIRSTGLMAGARRDPHPIEKLRRIAHAPP
jgi:hypothetical protein